MIVQTEGFGLSTSFSDFSQYGLFTPPSSFGVCTITSGGPFGDPYLDFYTTYAGSQTNYQALPTPLTTFAFGCRVTASSGISGGIAFNSSNGGQQFVVNFTNSTITVVSGSTTLGTATVPIGVNAWTYLEVLATLSATAGSITVRQDGVAVLSLTGVNNLNDSAHPNFASFGFVNYNGPHVGFAHVYVTNSTAPNAGFLGDVRVFSRFPSANSAVTFTPVGLANNYQNAANVPPVPATDYNTDATVGNQDTFDGASLPSGLGNIFAVGIKSLFQRTAAGARTVENVLVSGATTATGTAVTPPASPSAGYACDIFNTDPNTSAAWTEANAQATTFGYKIAS